MKEEREQLDAAYFRAVMETFSEEIRAVSQQLGAVGKDIGKISATDSKSDLSNGDLKRIDMLLRRLELKISSQERPRKIVIQLFPDQDRKLFYRIVFGRWLLYLVIACTVYWLVSLACLMEKNRHIERKAESDNRIRAWHQLYDASGKSERKRMERIYNEGFMQPLK